MRDHDHDANFDVVVVGGGPGGSTVATFVAMQGWRVLLLEKERFPRHQVGESLLPVTTNFLCSMLGVYERLEAANFVRKRGGTFQWGQSDQPWSFDFGAHEVLGETQATTAFQVERARFDQILFENAATKGVETQEGTVVTALLWESERVVGVEVRDPLGTRRIKARFVVDASGAQSSFYQSIGERKYSDFFKGVAVYGYFRGGKRLESPREGNVLSVAFQHGWIWYIPLSNELTSVGAVVAARDAALFTKDPESALNQMIAACPMVRNLLGDAARVTDGMYGKVRVRKDYSYTSTKYYDRGLCLIGDAACFVDPVFSTGVHLATYSALLAARSLNSVLSGSIDEARAFTEFEHRYRREYSVIYQFLTYFYNTHVDKESYFWNAKKVLNTTDSASDAFITLVAGASTTSHDFFSKQLRVADVYKRWLDRQTAMRKGERRPSDDLDREVDQILTNVAAESQQVAELAAHGTARPYETPLYEGGLIPSDNGLSWQQPRAASVAPNNVIRRVYPVYLEERTEAGAEHTLVVRCRDERFSVPVEARPLIEYLAARDAFRASEALEAINKDSEYSWDDVRDALEALVEARVISIDREAM